MYHSTIHKQKSNKMQQCIKILLFHPNCTGSLWFFICGRLSVRVVGGRCQAVHDNVQQLHVQQPPTYEKPEATTRGCQCSFRLLMMGGVSPETRWASYKYGTIKFWYIIASCWIFLYEFYNDARTRNVKFTYFVPSFLSSSFNLFLSLTPYNVIISMNYNGILGIISILMNFWAVEWLCYEFVTLMGNVQSVPKKSQMQISLLALKQCLTNNCILHCKVCFIIILHRNTQEYWETVC